MILPIEQPQHYYTDNFKFATDLTGSISERFKRPRYKRITISKNHSVVVTQDGELFSCGVGSRGRLGHGLTDLNNYFKFKRIEFFNDKTIKDVAISSNHSIALTTDNEVYAWGLNSFNQLGVPNMNNKNRQIIWINLLPLQLWLEENSAKCKISLVSRFPKFIH